MFSTHRAAIRLTTRGLSAARFASGAAARRQQQRRTHWTAVGLSAAATLAALASAQVYRVECDADEAQRTDPTGPPSGAKVGRKGDRSQINALEDIRGQGFSVDPQADKGKYITLAEVAQHHLAHDNWVVVDGKVFE
jgi:cytochrome b involved in lipid metabolism